MGATGRSGVAVVNAPFNWDIPFAPTCEMYQRPQVDAVDEAAAADIVQGQLDDTPKLMQSIEGTDRCRDFEFGVVLCTARANVGCG